MSVSIRVPKELAASVREFLAQKEKPKKRSQITLTEEDYIMLVHDITEYMIFDPKKRETTMNYRDFFSENNNVYTYYGQNKRTDFDGDLYDISRGLRKAFVVVKVGNRVLRVFRVKDEDLSRNLFTARNGNVKSVIQFTVEEKNITPLKSKRSRSTGIPFKTFLASGIDKILYQRSGIHPVKLKNQRIRDILGF